MKAFRGGAILAGLAALLVAAGGPVVRSSGLRTCPASPMGDGQQIGPDSNRTPQPAPGGPLEPSGLAGTAEPGNGNPLTRGAAGASVRLLALGDVNLGRRTGQEILRGDTLWPFVKVLEEFRAHDIVFLNLESNLSDQKGETQHPENNLIFTGPPAGAWSLKRAGVTVVSTANNHALDYGIAAKDSTISYLTRAGIAFAGTSATPEGLYEPAVVERKGVRFAFFAVTALMNSPGAWWRKHVAYADTATLLPRIRAWRPAVDVIVVSYHGGDEYRDRPGRAVREFAAAVLSGGADLFLGHHPHVPYGVVTVGQGVAAHSLGNFAFNQPQRVWTRRSFGLSVTVARTPMGAAITSWEVLPARAGWQPAFLPEGAEADTIMARVRSMSTSWNPEQVSWQ